jgi:queuine tRNA-ribosyltransferase
MSAQLDCEVVVTRGGARAMLDRVSGEVMHPVVGPRAEAALLYVEPARLYERLSAHGEPLVLLDVGLGAGSNAAAAYRAATLTSGRRLEIVSFERDLAAFELALSPENAADFGFEGALLDAARAVLREARHESERVHWRLAFGDLLARLALEPLARADVVFWDPFSPRRNPALWTVAAFSALRRACRPGATVHTYSAATATRSAMLLAGFAVGFGPPIGEKAHTTVAALDARDLAQPLDGRWFQRLLRSSAPLPCDAPAEALQHLRKLPQLLR